jgi:hypothetical protein
MRSALNAADWIFLGSVFLMLIKGRWNDAALIFAAGWMCNFFLDTWPMKLLDLFYTAWMLWLWWNDDSTKRRRKKAAEALGAKSAAAREALLERLRGLAPSPAPSGAS